MACYLKLHSRGSPLVVADPKSSPNALNQSGSPGMSCVMTGKVAFYYDKHSVVHVNFALFFIRHLCIGQKFHHCLIPVVPHTAVAEVSTRRRMARERRRACYSVVSSIKVRTFLEPKAPQSTYLKCTTRFVQCHLHSYTTDVNMYMNPNAEMTFTPPWNLNTLEFH